MNEIKRQQQLESLTSRVKQFEDRCNMLEALCSRYRDGLAMILAVDTLFFPSAEMRNIAEEVLYGNEEDER